MHGVIGITDVPCLQRIAERPSGDPIEAVALADRHPLQEWQARSSRQESLTEVGHCTTVGRDVRQYLTRRVAAAEIDHQVCASASLATWLIKNSVYPGSLSWRSE